jgi:hypothetical protein
MQGDGAASRLPARMFWVGLIVRVLYLTLAHTYKIRLILDHFQFGWEMGRIARALATGYGFADPFEGHSGPTAWTPPLYPLLLGGVFKLFGVYTRTSAWIILTVNSVFSAATAPAVYEMARRCFRNRAPRGQTSGPNPVALWSGWLWALYPAAMQYAVHWVWDMALTAFLFSWILVLALRVRGVGEDDPEASRHQTTRRWACFGLLWGLTGLTNSSLLVFLPACGIWMIWRVVRGHLAETARNVSLAAICCAAVLTPWIARNWIVFHAFIPMRSNFGAELYESVRPANMGFPWGGTIPLATNDPEYLRYKRMGEVAFSNAQGERAKALIRADKPRFAGYILKRAYMFWFGVPHALETDRAGRPLANSVFVESMRELNFAFLSVGGFLGLALALRHRIPGAWLFFWAFLVLPLVFYAVTVQARFRHPLEPIITVLIVYLFQSASPASSTRRGSGRPVSG